MRTLTSWGLLALLVLATPALGEGDPTASVQPGDTWDRLAQRYLGDDKLGSELKALNHAGGDPQPGTVVQLPGEDRVKALALLREAHQAVAASGAHGDGARSALSAAESAMLTAEYKVARARGEEALALAREAGTRNAAETGKLSRFSVSTTPEGADVVSESGAPVEVEAGGSKVVLSPGEGAAIGKTPTRVDLPAAPSLVEPSQGAVLKLPPPGKPELREAAFRWAAVPGATGYLLTVERAGRDVLKEEIAGSEFRVPLAKLGEGRLSWTVRAVDTHHRRGAPAPTRWIAVEVEPPGPTTLEVGKGRWE